MARQAGVESRADVGAPLEAYRSKRDFKTTPEPAGRRTRQSTKAAKAGQSFVIQKDRKSVV